MSTSLEPPYAVFEPIHALPQTVHLIVGTPQLLLQTIGFRFQPSDPLLELPSGTGSGWKRSGPRRKQPRRHRPRNENRLSGKKLPGHRNPVCLHQRLDGYPVTAGDRIQRIPWLHYIIHRNSSNIAHDEVRLSRFQCMRPVGVLPRASARKRQLLQAIVRRTHFMIE